MMPLAALDWHSTFFWLYALVACGFGVAVLASSNIVRMAFYLTLSLGATAGLFFLAGAEFLGAMQLMIYVGGTLVLLIFGVMLTAQDRFVSMKTGAGEWVIGLIVGAMLFLLLVRSGFSVEDWREPRRDREAITLADGKTSTPIGLALTGVRVDKLNQPSERLAGGMSGYLMPFVVISMHLLVVLIGAGYMARSKRAARGIYTEDLLHAGPRTRPKRRLSVTGGIVSGVLVNAVLMVLSFAVAVERTRTRPDDASPTLVQRLVDWTAAAPDWFWPAMGLLFLVNILLLIVVWYWQRWGVMGLVVVPIVQAVMIVNAALGAVPALAFLVFALIPVVLLIGLLNAGRPTLWSQMD